MANEIKLLIEKVKKIHKHNLNEHFSFDQSYFIKIINELYPNLNKEDIKNNKEEIIDKVISRGKLNITSTPSIEKLENWKKDINELLDLFEKNGEFKTDRDYEKEKEDIIRKYNMEMLNNTSALKQEFIELPEYLLKEVGFDNIIKFIKTEDDISYIVVGRDFTKFDKYGDDDIQNILNKPENKASWDEISAKLRHYYGKRAYWNIPTDKKFDSPKNAENFIKTYTQKFIYEYLLPRAKNYHKLVK